MMPRLITSGTRAGVQSPKPDESPLKRKKFCSKLSDSPDTDPFRSDHIKKVTAAEGSTQLISEHNRDWKELAARGKSWPWPDRGLISTACSETDFEFSSLTSYSCCGMLVVWLCIVRHLVWCVWSQVQCVVKCHWVWNPEAAWQLC